MTLTFANQSLTILPAMKQRDVDNLLVLEFKIFPNNGRLHHAVFTRQGGTSQGVFNSLNMSLSVPDDEEKVLANRAIGYGRYRRTNDTLVHAHLVHGAEVAAYLLKHDSIYGRYKEEVRFDKDFLYVRRKKEWMLD